MVKSYFVLASFAVAIPLLLKTGHSIWTWFFRRNSIPENDSVAKLHTFIESIGFQTYETFGAKRVNLQATFFFPDKGVSCKDHNVMGDKKCNLEKCGFEHELTSFDTLCHIISLAQETLDICVYIITNDLLAREIANVHKRGVIVRIIMDKDQCEASGTKRGFFLSLGIPVRCNIENLMHHKFIIMDNKILVNGSFNWTSAAVMGNHENIVVSTDTGLVNSFHGEFEKLWADFSMKFLKH